MKIITTDQPSQLLNGNSFMLIHEYAFTETNLE